MNILGRLAHHSSQPSVAFAANAVAKLERAFHSSIATYQRLKHGNRQVIRIERLVVQEGANAIIGQAVSQRS